MGKNLKNSPNERNLAKVKAASSLITLKYNNNFCNKFFEKSKISSIVEEPSYFNEGTQNLVYDLSRASSSNTEFFNTIIDLLLQLRAAQSDQNVFVQNNTVLREQILNQLKSEVLRVSHKLTKSQIKSLEVLSSNSFDEKALTDILKSFLTSSKKKFSDDEPDGKFHGSTYALLNLGVRKIISRYTETFNKINEKKEFFSKIISHVNSRHLLHTSNNLENIKPQGSVADEQSNKKLKNSKPKTYLIKRHSLESHSEKKSFYDLLGDNIIKSSNLILPLIKLQTKLSEINILSKTRLIAQNIVNKAISKTLPSEIELVNRVIEKTQISEIQESLLYSKERYENYKVKYQTEIKKIQNQLKKFQTYKSITSSKELELKSSRVMDLSIQNEVRKNVFRLISQNQVLRRIEITSENAVKNYLTKSLIHKHKVIDKLFENYSQKHERKAVYNSKYIKHKALKLEKSLVKDINSEYVLKNDIELKNLEYTNLIKNISDYTHQNIKNRHVKKIYSNAQKFKLRNLISESYEDKTFKFKSLNYDFYKKLSNKSQIHSQELLNFLIENKLNKEKSFSDFISKKIKLVFDFSESKFKNRFFSKIRVLENNRHKELIINNLELERTKIFKNLSEEEILKSLNVTEITKKVDEIQKLQGRTISIVNQKALQKKRNFIHSLNLPEDFKNIFKFTSNDKIYHLNNVLYSPYSDKSHMIYKQTLKSEEKEEKEPIKKAQKPSIKESVPDIKKVSKPAASQILDSKEIERKLMAQTLGKKEIINLIESYMSGINIEEISRNVLNKVEGKILMDKKRVGIF